MCSKIKSFNIFRKSTFSSIWFVRTLNFAVFSLIFLSINNKFIGGGEYYFSTTLNDGAYTFHNFHILSNSMAYLAWLFATLFGIEISAFRALQIASSIFAALGATALVDLGMFWGLSFANSLLLGLPIIFCNGYLFYGTSVYPGFLATGLGLLAINILVRSADARMPDKDNLKLLFIASILLGLTNLMHLAFAVVIPALLIGMVFIAISNKKRLKYLNLVVYNFLIGIFLILGLAYLVLLPICLKYCPDQVAYLRPFENGVPNGLLITVLTGKIQTWLPSPENFFTHLKTYGALLIPGVHSKNTILEIIFNIPRLLVVLLFSWFAIKAFKHRRENRDLFSWIVIFTGAFVSEFFFILFSGLLRCRQYASISLSVLGPLFMAIFILFLKERKKFLILIFLCCLMFYSIFGIEGIVAITTYDNRPILAANSKCGFHIPKLVHLPFFPRSCFCSKMELN